jgi:glycosyltransferase involved in cell wall biosynthesis
VEGRTRQPGTLFHFFETPSDIRNQQFVNEQDLQSGVRSGPARVWAVVAAYNEAARLDNTLRDLLTADVHVVVVDDGSTDRTAAVAAAHPVWVLRHPINCGQGAALRTGIAFALARGADAIVTFDGDGQHDASDIPRLIQPILAGHADAAIGSRFLGRAVGMPPGRRALLYAGRAFTRLFSAVSVSDPHNGLRALSRRAAERIRITQDGMAHASEIVEQLRVHGLRWREVPVTIRYSAATLAKGQSGWNAVQIVSHLLAARVVR